MEAVPGRPGQVLRRPLRGVRRQGDRAARARRRSRSSSWPRRRRCCRSPTGAPRKSALRGIQERWEQAGRSRARRATSSSRACAGSRKRSGGPRTPSGSGPTPRRWPAPRARSASSAPRSSPSRPARQGPGARRRAGDPQRRGGHRRPPVLAGRGRAHAGGVLRLTPFPVAGVLQAQASVWPWRRRGGGGGASRAVPPGLTPIRAGTRVAHRPSPPLLMRGKAKSTLSVSDRFRDSASAGQTCGYANAPETSAVLKRNSSPDSARPRCQVGGSTGQGDAPALQKRRPFKESQLADVHPLLLVCGSTGWGLCQRCWQAAPAGEESLNR